MTLKIAVFAPIPRVSARSATEVKARFLLSSLRPKWRLRITFLIRCLLSCSDFDVWAGHSVSTALKTKIARPPLREWRLAARSRGQRLKVLVKPLNKLFWGGEAPRGFESAAQHGLSGLPSGARSCNLGVPKHRCMGM